jgi:predicted transposase YbfD/YdcC
VPLGLTGSQAPDASAFRRLFARLDAAVLDTLIGAFLWTRAATVAGRRVIAIDGKTVRGARTATTSAPHLVAAFGQATGTVLGQLATPAKSNEIPTVRTLLATFDLTGVVVTVDAMHTRTTPQPPSSAAGTTSSPSRPTSQRSTRRARTCRGATPRTTATCRKGTAAESGAPSRFSPHPPGSPSTAPPTAISLLRLAGATNIAETLRHHARQPGRAINLLLTS